MRMQNLRCKSHNHILDVQTQVDFGCVVWIRMSDSDYKFTQSGGALDVIQHASYLTPEYEMALTLQTFGGGHSMKSSA